MGVLEELIQSNYEQAAATDELTAQVKRLVDFLTKDDPPPTPGMGSIEFTGEEHTIIGGVNVDLIKFKVTVPEEATTDVVSRNVKVTFADGSEGVDVVDGRLAGATKEFSGPQDSTVAVSIWNVDDAGNLSVEPRSFSAVLVDTVAPPTPGEAGLEIVGEETA